MAGRTRHGFAAGGATLRRALHLLSADRARRRLRLVDGRAVFLVEMGQAQIVLGRSLLERDRLDEAELEQRRLEARVAQLEARLAERAGAEILPEREAIDVEAASVRARARSYARRACADDADGGRGISVGVLVHQFKEGSSGIRAINAN